MWKKKMSSHLNSILIIFPHDKFLAFLVFGLSVIVKFHFKIDAHVIFEQILVLTLRNIIYIYIVLIN